MGFTDTVMFSVTRNENGEYLVSEPRGNYCYLFDIEILEKIIESCKKDKKKYPTNEIREAFSAKWEKEAEIKHQEKERAEKERRAAEGGIVRPKDCHIYLIQDTIRGFYKIGKAKNYTTRFSSLKTANPCIELVLAYSGIVEDEPFFHSYFTERGKHIGGEWFELTPDDVETILGILEKYNRKIIFKKAA